MEIKLNNSVKNLEWTTCSENNLHNHKMGLTNRLYAKNYSI